MTEPVKVDGGFSDGHVERWTWAETPLRVKLAYARLVMLAEISRFVCWSLRLSPMVEYKLKNGSTWTRKIP